MSGESKRPVSQYFWGHDPKYLLYAQDQLADENFNDYAIDPEAPAERATGVPLVRDLTNAKGSRILIFDRPKGKPNVLYIGVNDREKAAHDRYELCISTSKRTLLRKNR